MKSTRTKVLVFAVIPLLLIAGAVAGIFLLFSTRPAVPTSPIPKGQVEIHVEFKGLSTGDYNKLNAYVGELAEERSAFLDAAKSVRDVGEHSAYHGFLNDGFSDQRYNPNHPVPSPDVEKDMSDRLKAFLRDNKIDPDDVQLELRYGK